MWAARLQDLSSSSSSPVRSLPNTMAAVPGRSFKAAASSSGVSVKSLRFFPRRRVVPTTREQSATASAKRSKCSAFSHTSVAWTAGSG
jgi:hypothetical protein